MKSARIETEVLIAGGGVAGASLAIRLRAQGHAVLIVEKDAFPRHKLCGEFVSPECLVQFQKLGVLNEMLDVGGDRIEETRFYAENGRSLSVPSRWFFNGESGALGISRAEMDLRLLTKAREVGADVCERSRVVSIDASGGKVKTVAVKNENGELTEIAAKLFVDATGRARVLGKFAEKNKAKKPRQRKIEHIAFKAHFENVEMEKGVCEIYFFRGGYGGINYVENGAANHCFLIESAVAREFGGDADRIVEEVIFKNARVAHALGKARRKFEWLAVSVEKFGKQSESGLENLVSVGDAAAFIDPFTGSGMLMAMESSEILANAFAGIKFEVADNSVQKAVLIFTNNHQKATRRRLLVCSVIRFLSASPSLVNIAVSIAGMNRSILNRFALLTRPAGNP